MPKRKRAKKLSFIQFQKRFGNEEQCREFLFQKRWPNGFVCPKCGWRHYCKLSDGRIQCNHCHHQTSVTAGTVMHRTHTSLTKWFIAIYLMSQDKRGISAVQLQDMIGVAYNTALYMQSRIRAAMSERDDSYILVGEIEFDDAFFGGPSVGKKRGRGTEKAKVFVALSLNSNGKPRFVKMSVTKNIKQASVKRFAQSNIATGAIIHSDGYCSYKPALTDYDHRPKVYDPNSGLLHWLHIIVSNAKAYILGTYHGLPKKNLNAFLAEFCFRFNRRYYGAALFDRLAVALATSHMADSTT